MSEPFLGTVMIWAPNFAPRGWAFCQGQILSAATNAALFSVIGNIYGGDGVTDFALPNLAGRLPIGQGQSAGTSNHVLGHSGGAELVTLTQANLAPHTHGATVGGMTVSATVQASNTVNPAGNSTMPTAGAWLTASPVGVPGAAAIYSTEPEPETLVALGGVSATAEGGTVAVTATGSAVPFAILPPYQVLNYVIALEGAFPSPT
jgi:microcystin-dependent protein